MDGDPARLSPVLLAYVGDAVYELYMRTLEVKAPELPIEVIHQHVVRRVQARAQARALQQIHPRLSEAEQEVVRRGRNAKTGPGTRSADVLTYRRSTGLEALVGYLYLKGEHQRLMEVLGMIAAAVAGDEGDGQVH